MHEYECAMRRLRSVTDLRTWPHSLLSMLFSNKKLKYTDRFKMCCLLYGNGCSEADTYTLLKHRLRDTSAHRHVRSVLASIHLNRSKWHYYDVENRALLHFDHRPVDTSSFYTKKRCSWELYCDGVRPAPYRLQQAFFCDTIHSDAFTFTKFFFGELEVDGQVAQSRR